MKTESDAFDAGHQSDFLIPSPPQTADGSILEANMNLRWPIYLGSVVSILLVILVGVVALHFSIQQKNKELWVERTYQVLDNVEAVHHRLHNMVIARRGYRSTRIYSFLQSYRDQAIALSPKLNVLDDLVKDNPVQAARLIQMKRQINDLLNFWHVEDAHADNTASQFITQLTLAEKAKMNQLNATIDTIADIVRILLVQREAGNRQLRQRTESAIIVGSLLILIIVSFLIYFILTELKYRKSAYQTEREMNQLKSSFVSLASHEFRTPLSSISLSASLIEKYATSGSAENVTKHSNKIKATVNNLKLILEDFLSLEKLNTGMVKAKFQPFNLVELCEEIVEDMRTLLQPNQQLIYEHTGKDTVVKLDESLLRNAIINIVSNSIKYAGSHVFIILNTVVSENEVVIVLQDNGVGIAQKDQKNLFEPFFRVSNNGKVPGTGLGLNIVLRYIKLMKGHLTFSSKPFQETRFIMSFPTDFN